MRSIYGEDSNPLDVSEPAREENFLVSVRLRPLNRREITRHDVSDWECVNNTTIVSKSHDRGTSPTAYSFDRVFGSDSTTRQVYEEGAKKVALSVINGINASIFAYGQTSSGKTFTMSRVTEYTMADIYNFVTKHESREFVLKFAAMEIYNESVRDLLTSENTALRLLDDPERGTVVEKLTEVKLKDWEHLKGLLSACQAQRQVGETSLNEVSSRSHQILRLTVESSARKYSASQNSDMLSATVNFVDLAGSERASQTMSANTRLKEGCHINRSLLTLGSVIRKLSKGRNGHVPYRDSKLTRILQNSLGGNARTAIICTLSPAHSHFEQSRNTLLFASCAKQVTTSAQVNVVMSEKAMVKQLRNQLARMEKELKHLGSLSSNSSDSLSALQAKERLIEKMDKEIRELTQQRDHAHSRLHDLRHLRSSSWAESNFSDFDNEKGRVWEDDYAASEASDVGEPLRSENAITNASRRLSDRHEGVSNSKKNEESEGEEQLLSIEISPTHIIDKYFGPYPSLGWEKMSHTSEENIQETHQELQCVEVEVDRSSVKCGHLSSPQKSLDQESKANNNNDASEMDDLEIIDNTSDNEETSKMVAVDMNNNTIESTSQPIEDRSYSSDVDMSSISRGIADISRDGRCEAIIIIMSSPDRSNSENVTQSGSEVETLAKVEVADKEAKTKISNEEDIDERDDCSTLIKSDYDSKCMEQFGDISKYSTSFVDQKRESLLDNDNFVENLAYQKQNVDNYVSEDENNESEMMLYDSQVASSNKFSDFEKKRREIIELWNACNVQLIHRTYFFLLFKGEPADSIYLEVERRRLSYLRATLCKSAEAFYAKALLQERERLRRQILKKFSVKEMESIYEKWGIDLTSKQRRFQLCSRLWTNTKDMEHIKESAALVAKLVGLEEPSHAPKEIFGLSLPPAPIRSHSWHGLPALL